MLKRTVLHVEEMFFTRPDIFCPGSCEPGLYRDRLFSNVACHPRGLRVLAGANHAHSGENDHARPVVEFPDPRFEPTPEAFKIAVVLFGVTANRFLELLPKR